MKLIVQQSNRHVHLSRDHAIALFDTDNLPVKRWLDIHGEFVTPYKVLVYSNLNTWVARVLGPCRPKTQVELLPSDAPTVQYLPSRPGVGAWDAGLYFRHNHVIAEQAIIFNPPHVHWPTTLPVGGKYVETEMGKLLVRTDSPPIGDIPIVHVNKGETSLESLSILGWSD